ncbi:MOSC domain-containing protein [Agromyces sp. LHK192]|uniref:MOSC domain-containing protein n=1 Tax=Agromyces sp. LHK192 TaxID=2498704 RepID=UPI000FD76636|nr:MOSC domain-containing protein [Agromyces sp. LHK192]
MGHVDSVNLAQPRPNPYKDARSTGIGKVPVAGPVEVRAPGSKADGLGSGLVGDFIGDRRHHGGDDQAVYAFQREDLDDWETRLDRELPNGSFGENLTTVGVEVNDARIGEIWRVGRDLVLQVTSPRTPCATFRGSMGERGWAKTFAAAARPGAYLRVLEPGPVSAGDEVTVEHRPDHDVTVSLVLRATTTERELLPLLLAAGDDLDDELREMARSGTVFELD